MSTAIYETGNRVFEVNWEPGHEVPGRCRREATIRQLSGPPLTAAEWAAVRESIVRELINAGCRVYRAGTHEEER